MTAVDVSAVVLTRAQAMVEAEGLTDRVEFQRHDLAVTIPAGRFDLSRRSTSTHR